MIAVVIVLICALCIYFLDRADKVLDLKLDMIENTFKHDDYEKRWNVLERVSQARMVFSYKPIKLESFYTKEEIDILLN